MCDISLLRWVGWRWQRTIFFRHKCEILYKSLHISLHQIKLHCTFLISIKCRLNFLKWTQNYSTARLDLLGWSSGLHILIIFTCWITNQELFCAYIWHSFSVYLLGICIKTSIKLSFTTSKVNMNLKFSFQQVYGTRPRVALRIIFWLQYCKFMQSSEDKCEIAVTNGILKIVKNGESKTF